MIMQELEARAKGRGLGDLRVDSSLNAEAFYRRHGVRAEGRGHHALPSGRLIDCVRMRKRLTAA
jgi:putative acetyltransferase